MAHIASTTTLTDSLVARTLGTGVSQRGNTTSAEGGSGGGGGGDDPGNRGGGGDSGGGPHPAGGANPIDPGALSDKMIGKEPEVFTGDRDKVEEFMTSWSVYQGINKQTRVMNNPMS